MGSRTLIVSSYPPRRCGIGTYARATAERMRAAGDQVVVLSPRDGAGDVRVSFDGGRQFRRAARMGGAFDRVVVQFQPGLYYRPRAALAKVLTSGSLLWLVLRRPATEVVVHEADRPHLWRPDFVLLRLALARARLAFHTDSERRALEEAYRIRTSYRIVEHGEGVGVTPPIGRTEARGRLSIDPDELLFLCAGFLHPDKGFERPVRALGEARGARLVILGSVRDATDANLRYARSLRDLCERTPGASLIEGYVSDDDFDAWIQAADRLVLPYLRSWSSGALARARLLGTPAIVSDVGGLPEQAGPGDVVFSNEEELADAMAQVAGERPRAETGS